MNTKSKWLYGHFLITAILFLSGGCNKNDESSPPPTPTTKTDLLTHGSWKLTGAHFHGDSDNNGIIEDIDLMPGYQACFLDDFTIYYANGKAQNNEGPTKCDPTTAQTYDFDWEFKENETILNTGGKDFAIVELTATTFKYVIHDPYGNGSDDYISTFTFSH